MIIMIMMMIITMMNDDDMIVMIIMIIIAKMIVFIITITRSIKVFLDKNRFRDFTFARIVLCCKTFPEIVHKEP